MGDLSEKQALLAVASDMVYSAPGNTGHSKNRIESRKAELSKKFPSQT